MPFGGPWGDALTFRTETGQNFSVPNSPYFQVAGWVEWHDRNGNFEAHAPFVYLNWVRRGSVRSVVPLRE